MPTLEEIRARFQNDHFATQAAGVEIREATPGRAVCAMALSPIHYNAAGIVQGGAIFTLADFAFAVAANGFAERLTISLQHDVTFLRPARGTELIATAQCLRAGRTACFYTVEIADDAGAQVAYMTVNGFTTSKKPQNPEILRKNP